MGLNYQFGAASAPKAKDSPNQTQTQQRVDLATQSGVEVGAQISSYRYQEHDLPDQLFMKTHATRFGATLTATKAWQNSGYISADSRFSYGTENYFSPASGDRQKNIPNYLGELRFLAGKDFHINQLFAANTPFVLSPYIGVGYRNLFNDSRGTTMVGDHEFRGFRRDIQYLYLPVGMTQRFAITQNVRLSTNVEYDQLIEGWVTNYEKDIDPSLPNSSQNQFAGYGLRGSVMLEKGSWSLGPFANYWNVPQSAFTTNRFPESYVEPHNQTIEYGLQLRYRF